MVGGVKVAYVSNRSIPLVKRDLAVDDQLSGIGTRDRRASQWLLPFHWDDG